MDLFLWGEITFPATQARNDRNYFSDDSGLRQYELFFVSSFACAIRPPDA